MKIILTAAEAAPLVLKGLLPYKSTYTEEVEITNIPPPSNQSSSFTADETETQLRLLARYAASQISDMKYAAVPPLTIIKRLREFTAYGLVEARWAVENWSVVFDYVERLGRFPVIKDSQVGTLIVR